MNISVPHKTSDLHLLNELKKAGISKQVLQSLIFRLTGLGLIFGLQVMLARFMGPVHYGDYIVIITIINILLVVSMFGLDSAILRFVPAYMAKNDLSSAKGFVKFSYRVVILLSLACSVGLFIFLLAKSKQFNISFSEGFFWGILLIPFLALIYQASAVLRALHKFKTSLMAVYFLLPLTMGLVSLYYYRSHNQLTVDATMLINLSCTIVICIFITRKAKKIFRAKATVETATYNNIKWISVSGVLFLTTSLDLLLSQSDILMVSYFMGNTHAGYYAVAARLATLTSLGLSIADYVFMPKIAALFESRQLIKLQQLVRNSSLQVLSITLPIVCTLFIGGKWILGMFGPQYASSYTVLVILLCGQLVNSFTGMVGGLMTMTGHQRTFFIFYLFAFAIQFLLNIILIPAFGIIGAAIGTSLSMIVLNLCAYAFVKRKMKIKASFM